MKMMIKYLLPVISALLGSLLVTDLTSAQSQEGAVGVSVNVVPAAAETITLRDMDFSDLNQNSGTVEIHPVNSARAGKMLITGTPNAPFRLSYLPVRLLQNQLGNGFLSFEYLLAGNHIDDQTTAEIFREESRELQFNENGEFYIWIGGSVSFENASPGSYTGNFTLEIDYI